MTRTVTEAIRDYAIKAHGDQLYGDRPYSVHLDAVAELVPDVYKQTAYQHDLLEDTSEGLHPATTKSGRRACGALCHMHGMPREEYIRGIILYGGIEAIVVKLADSLSNLLECLMDQVTEASVVERRIRKYVANLRQLMAGLDVAVDDDVSVGELIDRVSEHLETLRS